MRCATLLIIAGRTDEMGLMWSADLQVTGVRTFFGITFKCRAAVITTGTFMNGRIWVGRTSMPAGR